LTGAELRSVEVNGRPIHYQLRRSDRKTLSVTVEPDRRVVVIAPLLAAQDVVDARIRRRAAWIRRQQQYFDSLPAPEAPRHWVSGETHRYLGRQYRLKLVCGSTLDVRLIGGYFIVRTPDLADTRTIEKAMVGWYRAHASELLRKRLRIVLEQSTWLRLSQVPQLTIRRMKLRWGSTTPGGRVCLNLDLIKLPLGCIDYVVAHELVHLRVPNHGAEFWRLLGRVLPEWKKWQRRLEHHEV
jgi:predicted metal-dependent hydrolase